MFEPTYLYIKTHNKTGLKYFGKTVAKDPHKYRGSGTYWLKHLKKHGYDVTTEILGYYIDEEECKTIAIQFSKDNNIVESQDWANLTNETLTGGWVFANENDPNISKNALLRDKEYQRQYSQKGGIKSFEEKTGIFSLTKKQSLQNAKFGRERIKEIYGVDSVFSILNTQKDFIEKRKKAFKKIKHQQGEKNSQYGTMWICNHAIKKNKRINKCDPIPEGWAKGRKMNYKKY